MNLRLLAIRSLGTNYCEADFVVEPHEEVSSSRFRIDDSGDVPVIAAESDVFRSLDGTAAEFRCIYAAISAFCKVSTRGSDAVTINGHELPLSLIRAIHDGRWQEAAGSPKLAEVFAYSPFDPSFYSLESIAVANRSWPPSPGRPTSERRPRPRTSGVSTPRSRS